MTIKEFIHSYPAPIKDILEKIVSLLDNKYPDLSPDLKLGFKSIYYKADKVVLGVNPYKNYVSIHFMYGAFLDDTYNLLEGSGNKLRHIKFHSVDEVAENSHIIDEYISQSCKLILD